MNSVLLRNSGGENPLASLSPPAEVLSFVPSKLTVLVFDILRTTPSLWLPPSLIPKKYSAWATVTKFHITREMNGFWFANGSPKDALLIYVTQCLHIPLSIFSFLLSLSLHFSLCLASCVYSLKHSLKIVVQCNPLKKHWPFKTSLNNLW